MSDDEDFSLDDDESEDDAFAPDEDEAEEEEEAFADDSAASDASDVEKLAPKPKRARVSPKKAAKTSTPKAKKSNSSVKKTPTPKAKTAETKAKTSTTKKSPPAKPLSAGEAEAAVLDYMRKTNRPYSLLNVFENLHRAIAKPSLTKLLDNLVTKEELASKTYGKAKIYYMNQNKLPVPSEEERVALEEQIKTVTGECSGLEQELKTAETTLAGITSQISDADLDAALKQLDEEASSLEKRIETLDRPDQAPVSPGRKDALKRKFTTYRTAWVSRKRIAMDGVNQIADGMEKKPKAVMDLCGIETDAEAGIKEIPSI
ncbi:PSMC3 interacting protein [Phytophthora boehmeriae]|uniref:PSMC3 interacting protein n=1 Tax=Phytophthora boehmeriae TaxID=109152 RepID=A0A8T1WRI6_9STRA|nr:PSMC3 interacting protein [Phytophthora boehmeriae]